MTLCSHCGYSIEAFDRVCPRCHAATAQDKNQIAAGPDNPSRTVGLPPVGTILRQETAAPSRQAPPPTQAIAPGPVAHQPYPHISPTPQAESFNCNCIVCGNEDVQKVTAICNQNHWTENSSGHYQGVNVGHGFGRGGGLNVGVHGGTINTATSGRSHLARLLTPPAQPRLASRNSPLVFVCVLLAIPTLFLTLGAFTTQSFGLILAALVFGGGAATCGYFGYLDQTRLYQEYSARKMYEEQRWQEAMQRWNQLFYCPRCDNVYYPQSQYYTAPDKMYQLL